MNKNGIVLDVFHNYQLDGKGPKVGGYKKYWNTVTKQFPEAAEKCNDYIKNGGR